MDDPPAQIVFRPSKKRKVFRPRPDADAVETSPDVNANSSLDRSAQATPASEYTEAQAEDSSIISQALRLRQARKRRQHGTAFQPAKREQAEDDGTAEQALIVHDAQAAASAEAISSMSDRFAPQTGLVGELVNRHMEEYIEAEMAKRTRSHRGTNGLLNDSSPVEMDEQVDGSKTQAPSAATRGRIQEIDLGDEARLRNVALTGQATKRLDGTFAEANASGSTGADAGKAVRLGRDGKPLRGRKRRTSEDVKRDQLVEEFLRENRLDVYEAPTQQESLLPPGEDEGLDERIAADFKREFMEAMTDRRRRKKPAAVAPKPGAPKPDEKLKGPKLGGSRNARAAMRDALLLEQEKKKPPTYR